MTIESVIFDMDGLLVDSETVSAKAFIETTEAYELGDRYDLFLSLVGTNEFNHGNRLRDALGHLIDPDQFRLDWIERIKAEVEHKVPPLLTGAAGLLEWLKNQDIPCALATSATRAEATHKLTSNGIEHYFSTYTCGDDVVNSKPYPEIYLKAAKSIDVNPANSMALEDSENGVKAAVAAGMHVVQIPNLVQPSAELLKLGHHVRSDLNDVLAMLKAGFPEQP